MGRARASSRPFWAHAGPLPGVRRTAYPGRQAAGSAQTDPVQRLAVPEGAARCQFTESAKS